MGGGGLGLAALRAGYGGLGGFGMVPYCGILWYSRGVTGIMHARLGLGMVHCARYSIV